MEPLCSWAVWAAALPTDCLDSTGWLWCDIGMLWVCSGWVYPYALCMLLRASCPGEKGYASRPWGQTGDGFCPSLPALLLPKRPALKINPLSLGWLNNLREHVAAFLPSPGFLSKLRMLQWAVNSPSLATWLLWLIRNTRSRERGTDSLCPSSLFPVPAAL